MKKEGVLLQERFWRSMVSKQAQAAFFSALLFGLFAHGTGLFNKLSHQDDIANLFGFGATITSGRWMLHILSWLESLFFGTGNTSIPLYNGLISILCVGMVCVLLVIQLRIRNPVYCALLGCLMVAFPVMTALFSYMFTSLPYMIGLLMMTGSACLICRNEVWWMKFLGILLGGAAIGVYQAFLPVLLTILLIYDMMILTREESAGAFLHRIVIQIVCLVGVLLVYFGANWFFLYKFNLTLTSYQGIDRMGVMSISTFLERSGKAYHVFLFPPRDAAEDMYPGTLTYFHGLMTAANVLLAVLHVFHTGKTGRIKAIFLTILYLLIPLGCNFIYVMSEEVHGLMVFGQTMQFVLLIAQLEWWETDTFQTIQMKQKKIFSTFPDDQEKRSFQGVQIASLAASLILTVVCVMYARFDNQCYLKDTLQQQEAMSYYTTLITQIKSQPGYTPNTEICFVNDWQDLDPTIYNLDEMNFIHLNLYGRNTTEYIHIAKEFFMKVWCGFEANWYWGEDPAGWPEVQSMPEYPADGSIQMIHNILIVKF